VPAIKAEQAWAYADRSMRDIVANALLMAAAVLGCVRFVGLFGGKLSSATRDQVATTVGVTAFLTAAGRMLERGGLAAAALLLLLAWLIFDTTRRHALSEGNLAACAWLSLVFLLAYVGLDRY
jgi:hypothetical protein